MGYNAGPKKIYSGKEVPTRRSGERFPTHQEKSDYNPEGLKFSAMGLGVPEKKTPTREKSDYNPQGLKFSAIGLGVPEKKTPTRDEPVSFKSNFCVSNKLDVGVHGSSMRGNLRPAPQRNSKANVNHLRGG